MTPRINVIVAVCENMGIGVNGGLPWKLKSELAHFARITKTTSDVNKNNMVIMGRRTWESIPNKFRPLPGRLNAILSSTIATNDVPEKVLVFSSYETAVKSLQESSLSEQIETAWVIGGSSVYKIALESEFCSRVYITKIHKAYNCDTFFSQLDMERFRCIEDPTVPQGLQEEDGINFEYLVYEKVNCCE